VCSLECFSLGEKSFAQARVFSAKAKKDPALWTIFAQAINFFPSGEGYFRSSEIGLAQAKLFFFFGFLILII